MLEIGDPQEKQRLRSIHGWKNSGKMLYKKNPSVLERDMANRETYLQRCFDLERQKRHRARVRQRASIVRHYLRTGLTSEGDLVRAYRLLCEVSSHAKARQYGRAATSDCVLLEYARRI